MNSETLGLTHCADCRGSGIRDSETACPSCQGTGLVAAVKESTTPNRHAAPSGAKRRFNRYYTDLPIRVRDQRDQEWLGRCVVIAEGGLAAILPEPISTGSVAILQLSIRTHPAALEVWAVVRSQQGLRHGFEFVSLRDAERTAILEFCNGLMVQTEAGHCNS